MRKIYLLFLTIFSIAAMAQVPSNDACTNALAVALPSSGSVCFNSSNTNATSDGIITCDSSGPGKEVWFTFIATNANNTVTVTPNGASPLSNIVVTLTTSGCSSGTYDICNSGVGAAPVTSTLGLAPGTQVWVSVESNGGATGDFQICINSDPPSSSPGDGCAQATNVCDKSTITYPSMAGFTASGATPSCFLFAARKDVFVKFTVGVTGTLQFTGTVLGAATEYDWALFDITSGCLGTEVACNYRFSGATTTFGMSAAAVNCTTNDFCPPVVVTAGRTYALLIDNFTQNNVGFSLDWGGTFQMGTAADFTVTPQSSCTVPQTVTITNNSVGATTYAWNFGDGATSTAANPGTHTYNSPGDYLISLVVTGNGCTSVISKRVNLNAGPVITVTPPSATICSGQSVNLNAVVSLGTPYNDRQFSNSVNTAIPNNNTAGLTNVLNSSGMINTTLSAGAVQSICFTINHTNHSDIGRTNANAVTVTVNGNTYNFTPLALPAVSGTATYCFPAAVLNAIGAAGGNANTAWTLKIADERGGGGGTGSLVSWDVTLRDINSITGFSWSPTTNMTNSTTLTPTVSPTSTVTYTLTANDLFGCTRSFAVPITVNSNVTPTFTPVAPICSGAALAALPTTSNNGITGTWSPAINNTTTTTYTFTPNVGQCATTTPMQIVVNPSSVPVTGFSYPTPVCMNGVNPSPTGVGGFTAGGTYSSTAGLSINAATGVITLSGSTAGTYTVTYTVPATACSPAGSSTFNITLTTVPTASISYAGTPFCTTLVAGQPVTLTGTGAYLGGTYSSTAGLTINAGTGAITPNTSTPGTYTVTYTIAASGGCAAVPVTTSVTISAAPTATISYVGSPFCTTLVGAQSVTQTGTAGGTYSSTAGLSINAGTGAITPSTSTPGIYTVTYTIPASAGCAAVTATTSVTITAAPTATISYVGTPFCAGPGTANVTMTGTPGGTYSSTMGLIINGATGAVDLATSTPGTYTVTYTIAASGGCAAVLATTSITINPTTIPVTGFSYPTPVCMNGANPSPTGAGGFTTGGTYSSTVGLSINAATGVITLASSTAGTYTVTYTVPATICGPVGISTFDITLTAVPTASISYAGTPFCTTLVAGQSVTLTGTGAYLGGIYSSTAGLSINAGTGTISPSTSLPGTYTVTYTTPVSGGCAAVIATTSVTITAAPTAFISYAGTPFCATISTPQAVSLSGTGAYLGGTYSSTAGLSINVANGDIMPSTSTPGTYTVTYTVAASGGCASVVGTTTITITASPTATINYAGTPFCSGSGTATVTQTGTTGGTYSSTVGLVIDSTTGAIDLATSTPGAYTITYTIAANGGCSAVDVTTSIMINSTTIPVTGFSYPTPICINGVDPTPTEVAGFTTGGTYSSTAGLSINAATGVITLASSTAGTYTVTYTVPATICGPVGINTFNITITPVPTAAISYVGTPFCSNLTSATVNLSGAGAYTGGVYSSTAGLTIDAVTGEINPSTSTAGTYTVTYTILANGGCAAVPVTTSITITDAPTATISYAGTPFCASASIATVTQTGTTGGTYSSSAGLVIDPVTGDINLGASTPGTYTVTYTIAASGGCAAVAVTTSVTINPSPTPNTGFSYTTPVCINGTNPMPIGMIGFTTGGTYSSTAGLTINPTTGEIDLATSTAGTYTVTYTVVATACNPLGSSTFNITLTTVPTVSISYSGTPFCATISTPQAVSLSGTGAYTGGTYSSTAGLTIDPVTGDIIPSSSAQGTYTVTYTVPASGGCASVSTTSSVTISSAPNASIVYPSTPYCSGAGIASVGLTGALGGAYSSTVGLVIDPTTGDVDLAASIAGTYTVTYTIAASGGCAAVIATTQIVINPSPTPITGFSYVTPVCSNSANPMPIHVAGFTTGGRYTSTAGLTINAATGEIDLTTSTPGTYTVTYTFAATACGSAGSSTFNITITELPTGIISYATPFCPSEATPQTVTLTGIGVFSGGMYSAAPAGLTIDAVTGDITPSTSVPGMYVVTYMIPANGGCGTVPVTTNVTINQSISVSVEQGCINGSYTLTAMPNDASLTYAWHLASSPTILGTDSTLVVSTPGQYVVEVTSFGSCLNSQQANVLSAFCDIPKGISPNGDNLNDSFDIAGLNAHSVEIFNRYGVKVYNHGSGYTNQWHGQSNSGHELPDGTYYYVIDTASGQTKTGWVYINKEVK